MPTSLAEFTQWLEAPRENENLEFKEASVQYDNTKLFRHCVALANEGGGKLILGVTDAPPRKVLGTQSFHTPAGIQSRIFDKLRFRVEVEEFQHPDGRAVIFHIPPRPRGTAYNLEGAYFMRSTEGTVPMSEDRLREIFDEGKPDWLMRSAREDCTATDVIRLLDTQVYFDLQSKPYPTNQSAVIERFESEKFIQEDMGGYTISNLGAVLFAKRMDQFEDLFRKAPRVIVYDGPDKLSQSRVVAPGTKGYVVGFSGLIDFVGAQIPVNDTISKALRKEIKMFPDVMLRELVANALIHQDFNETGTSVTVEIYSNRMEILNPGTSIISPDRFIDEYQSRNEKLADVMRRMGICEEQGKGVDKVVKYAEVCQLPPPDWRSAERHTIAVVFAHKEFDEMDGSERIRAAYQHCTLKYLTNERMNNQSLRERFKLSKDKTEVVSGVIYDALRDGKIKPEDPAKTSRRYAKYIPYWA